MMGNYHVAFLGEGDTVMYALLPSEGGTVTCPLLPDKLFIGECTASGRVAASYSRPLFCLFAVAETNTGAAEWTS